MQANVDPNAGALFPEEPTRDAESGSAEHPMGFDGAMQDRAELPERLNRKLKRQSVMYGHETARDYLASLLELDAQADDFYSQADDALGVVRGSIRQVIEGPEQ